MNVAIRVDASGQIGTGHFMRCLTLADALHTRAIAIRFISRHLPQYLQKILTEKGYECTLLEGLPTDSFAEDLAHSHWLETTQSADAEAVVQVLSDKTWEWMIVDHYALDSRWESALRQTVRRILVIDDIADRPHDCDVLLDQNFYSDMEARYAGKVPAYCKLLLGPRYALLRDEFRQLRQQLKPRTVPVKRILLFFGGVDTENYTAKALSALDGNRLGSIHVDVVIGLQNPFRAQIEALCAAREFTSHVQTSRMGELMAAADLAIGAGGSATWERCCLGLPTIAIATAENQIMQVRDAACEGLLYAPDTDEDVTGSIHRHLFALIENTNLLRLLSRNAFCAVDGKGVLRVIREMRCSGIEIRISTLDDSENLFKWRNHNMIRAVSRNSHKIEWRDHQKWFAAVLSSSERALLIGTLHEVAVGVVRFDIQDSVADVSIYVVPDIHLSGIGYELLQSAEEWLKKFRPEIDVIKAVVLGGNERSHHLFSGAGYKAESTSYLKRIHAHG